MHNSDQETQDQRKLSSMDDSTAMTIEFLRARLLSERSVSRSARQRADELAERVAELEEQLKIVSLQRKMAEKATADVLAILESNGVSDISDEFDSSSDQETPCGSKLDNSSIKEEEGSVSSKVRRKETGELSGSDIDFSPIRSRSLSWKGRKSASHSPEKCKDYLLRKCSGFASIGFSSPKHHQGKSCRQIRCRGSRSGVQELKTDNIKVDSQENILVTSSELNPSHSEVRHDILTVGSEIHKDKVSTESLHSDSLKERNATNSDLDFHGYEVEKDMEKALEHQAQLIGRYEAMERAQREWEEKFRENNNSTPDSCDPGNHSDITEERDEIKTQAQFVSGTNASHLQQTEEGHVAFSKELPKTQYNDFAAPSHGDMGHLQNQVGSSTPAIESSGPQSTFPIKNHSQESLQSKCHMPSHGSHHHPHPHSSQGNQPMYAYSSDGHSSSCTVEASTHQDQQYALVPHETSSGFGGVLDALKQARLSLKQKMSSLSLAEGESFGKPTEISAPVTKHENRIEIPVGCGGLFRVPTDFSAEVSKANILGSGTRLSLGSYPDTGLALTARNQLVSNSYTNTRSSISSDNKLVPGDGSFNSTYMNTTPKFSTFPAVYASPAHTSDVQLCTSPYAEMGSRISTQRPTFDPHLDAGLASAGLNYLTFPSHPKPGPPTTFNQGFPTFLVSPSVGAPPNRFSFYDDHFRPDMYR